jgi:hypothetical protein
LGDSYTAAGGWRAACGVLGFGSKAVKINKINPVLSTLINIYY